MKKMYLAMWMCLCEGTLKVKITHFCLPSAPKKRECLSSLVIKMPLLFLILGSISGVLSSPVYYTKGSSPEQRLIIEPTTFHLVSQRVF